MSLMGTASGASATLGQLKEAGSGVALEKMEASALKKEEQVRRKLKWARLESLGYMILLDTKIDTH